MRKRATRLGLAIACGSALLSSAAGAVNERWYSMQNCGLSYLSPQGELFINEFGINNTAPNGGNLLNVSCAQPHFYGNNGYDASSAVVIHRKNGVDFFVSLCRSNGTTGPAICDDDSTATVSGTPQTLSFPGNVDGTRSYYYWAASVPERDAGGGYSALISFFFDDN